MLHHHQGYQMGLFPQIRRENILKADKSNISNISLHYHDLTVVFFSIKTSVIPFQNYVVQVQVPSTENLNRKDSKIQCNSVQQNASAYKNQLSFLSIMFSISGDMREARPGGKRERFVHNVGHQEVGRCHTQK